jgi:signal transduction histidine kinase
VVKSHGSCEKEQTFEYRIVRPNGEIRLVRSRIIALRNEEDEHYPSVGYSEDITEQRVAEDALKRSHEDLERRVKERTDELLRLNTQLSERERLSAGAYEMGQSVLGSIDLDVVLDAFAQNLVKAGQFRSLMIALVNEEIRSLEVVRLVSRYAGRRGMLDDPKVNQPDSGIHYDLDSENITCEVARIEIVDGWDTRFDQNLDNPQSPVYENKVSYFIPIRHGPRTTAVVATASTREERDETVRRIEVMRPLFDQVAIALDHANLYKIAEERRREIEESNTHLRLEILERQQAEAALRDALVAAEAKGEFLENMNHEIRTFINGILGMAELLGDTTLDKEQSEHLDMLLTSGKVLLRVVNDLLDFSRIEAGKLNLENIPFNLKETVKDICTTMGHSAQRKGLKLQCDIGLDVPMHLTGDPGRLQQVFFNLIGNAR